MGVCATGLIEDGQGRIHRGTLNPHNGYYYFRGMAVHRLVLNVFDPAGYHKVWLNVADHINRDRADNRAANLRWSNSTLNSLNKSKVGWTRRANCYQVQFTVLGHQHSTAVSTPQEAVYTAGPCTRALFDNLQCLYSFLASHDVVPGDRQHPHKWLARHFSPRFLRRLAALPKKRRPGRRRTIT